MNNKFKKDNERYISVEREDAAIMLKLDHDLNTIDVALIGDERHLAAMLVIAMQKDVRILRMVEFAYGVYHHMTE